MINWKELNLHIEGLYKILNKKLIKEDLEARKQLIQKVDASELCPQYKKICTEIIKNL